VGGSIKLDLTYATIPTFGGEERMLYKESRYVKTVTPAKGSKISPTYGKESDLSCLFLEEDETILEKTQVLLTMLLDHQHIDENQVCKLYLDGTIPKREMEQEYCWYILRVA